MSSYSIFHSTIPLSFHDTAMRVLRLLFCRLAATSPLSESQFEHVATTISTNNLGNLTYNYSPAGLLEFVTAIDPGPHSLNPEDCLHIALETMTSQAVRDWDSRLADRTMTWGRPPHMAIVAQSLTARPMEQRFAVWAIIRIMDQMVRINRYVEMNAALSWRGEGIGRLAFVRYPATGGHDILRTPNSTISRTMTELGGEGLTFELVRFFGPPNSMAEVFMGSIASIVRAGERHNGNVLSFTGLWTGSSYTIFQTWWTKDRPSRLSKQALILSMWKSTQYASEMKDYRCMQGAAKSDGRYIGEGGYIKSNSIASS